MLDQKGQIFILAIIVLTLVMVNILIMISGALFFRQNSRYSTGSVQAVNLAEAGIDKAVASLNATAGTYAGEAETTLGPGTFETSVTTLNSNTKIVNATGYIPNKSKATTKRTIQIQVSKGLGVSFNYGIQSGEGGLQMSNNSTVNGSVYSNGNITMGNGAKITGDAYVAGGAQPTPDQQSDCTSPNCADFIFGKNVSGNNQLDIAQSFQPSVTDVLTKISLKLKKFGTPPDLTVRILGDSSGHPNNSNILTSGTLTASLVTTNYGFVDVIFSSPPTLSANTPYWIVIDTSSDSSNYWAWSNDITQGYTRGSPKWSPDWQGSPSPTWNTLSGDLGFKSYIDGVSTSLVGSSGVSIGGNAHAHDLENFNAAGGAYYQTLQNVTASSYHPGSSDPVSQPFSISDNNIQDWKNEAVSNGVHSGDITTCTSSLTGKYIGNLTPPNNCTMTVNPPVWITGDTTLSNGDILKLNSTYSGSSGVVIVSGKSVIQNNNKLQGTGVAGSYLILLSDYNSKDDPLHGVAIDITNNGNSGEVYSNLGSIHVANNNAMTEITSWKLILDPNVTINYDQGLASAFFSSGPGGTYSAVKGTYQLK